MKKLIFPITINQLHNCCFNNKRKRKTIFVLKQLKYKLIFAFLIADRGIELYYAFEYSQSSY